MSFITETKEKIAAWLIEAAEKAKACGELDFTEMPDFTVEPPKERAHGDFAANVAMLLARQAKKPPRVIAETILKYLPAGGDVPAASVAGAGFINFVMPSGWLSGGLADAVRQGRSFGQSLFGAGERVQVEFVSANPTGELHMGNARGAAIGDSLANILAMAGFAVEREFYINDAGHQIVVLGETLEARFWQQLGKDVPVPEDGYQGEDIIVTVRQFLAAGGEKYKDEPREKRLAALIEFALKQKLQIIKETLERFGVFYDVWYSEKSLYQTGKVDKVLNLLKEQGYAYEKEGALWFDADRFGAEKPEVLVRQNGIPTYYASDIAYHLDKFDRGFNRVINIWGADHHGHVARLRGAIQACGYPGEKMQVILMQLVRLLAGGEVVRMSKRAGSYVTLEELMDDVGVDAARFFFVLRGADSQMDFDLDLAKEQSADNPVFYVQYAHARICSILRQALAAGSALPDVAQVDFSLLQEPAEELLIRKLLDYPDEIVACAQFLSPHRLAQYVLDLAGLFHNFYNHCRVLGIAEDLSVARLWLCRLTADVVASALKAMGVTAPEQM